MPTKEDIAPITPTDLKESCNISKTFHNGMNETAHLEPARELYNCEGLSFGPFDNRFKILYTIGGGSFGHVFIGENSMGEEVVVKGEMQGTGCEKLLHEGNMYMKLQGQPGIPTVYWYGMYSNKYNFLVMEKCGLCLYDLLQQCGGKFSVATVLKLAIQMLEIIKSLHGNNILHRDISPGNFLIGSSENFQKLLLIDFGLAKPCPSIGKLRLPSNGYRYQNKLAGTPNFISLSLHKGYPESRRDDLESIAYLLIFLLKGELPWSKTTAPSKQEALLEIGQKKAAVSLQSIAENIPVEFVVLLDYARKLKPADVPDYDGLKTIFSKLAAKLEVKLESAVYDWDQMGIRIMKSELPVACDTLESSSQLPADRCGCLFH